MCFQRDFFHQKYNPMDKNNIVQLMRTQTIATTANCSGGVSRGVNITLSHTHTHTQCVSTFVYLFIAVL